MQELSASKKMEVIKLYFDVCSYNEIAKKAGVSRGSISNIILDLKEGFLPEISTIPEEIEQLRDLAISIQHSGISPIQANISLSVLEKMGSYRGNRGVFQGSNMGTIYKMEANLDTTKRYLHKHSRIN